MNTCWAALATCCCFQSRSVNVTFLSAFFPLPDLEVFSAPEEDLRRLLLMSGTEAASDHDPASATDFEVAGINT